MGKEGGAAFVVVSALAFGFMPIFARLAYSQGVGVDELLFVRFLLAFVIMGAILLGTRRLVIPKRRDLLTLIGLGGIGYFTQSTLYFTSLVYSPVAIVALLLYTYPVFVTMSAYALGLEEVPRRLTLAFVIALVGLLLVVNPFNTAIGLGVILALGSSVAYTIYILVGSSVLGRVDGNVAIFYVMGAAATSFGLAGAFTGSIRLNWSLEGWFWVAMITIFCTVVALTTFFIGLSKIGPSRAALISLLEPVTSILASVWLFGNALGPGQWFGGVLILVATSIATVSVRPVRHGVSEGVVEPG